MMSTWTVCATRPKATAVALLVGAAVVLAACGGSKTDGTFFDRQGQLTLDGSKVTYHRFECNDDGTVKLADSPGAEGTLSDDKSSVRWNSGRQVISDVYTVQGTSPVTMISSGKSGVVRIDDFEYRAKNKKKAFEAYERTCTPQ